MKFHSVKDIKLVNIMNNDEQTYTTELVFPIDMISMACDEIFQGIFPDSFEIQLFLDRSKLIANKESKTENEDWANSMHFSY